MKTIQTVICIECEKSGYEAGLIHGKQLKSQIHDFYEFACNSILQDNESAFFELSSNLFLPHIPEVYQEEMQGIADGAEIDLAFILTINTYDDIMSLLACSSMGILKSDAADTFYHARNLDYSIDYLAGKTVLTHYKQSGNICIGFPGYIGGITSTNIHGISISSHTLPQTDNYKTEGIPSGILYRMITEKATTIQEALDILDHPKRATCHSLLISSEKENKVTVAEIHPNKVVTRAPNAKGILSTNHYVAVNIEACCYLVELVHLGFRKIKLLAGKIKYKLYNMNTKKAENALKDFIAQTFRNSSGRYQMMERFLQVTSTIDLKNIKKIMHSISQDGPSSFTIQSVIFSPQNREVHIATKKSSPVTGEDYLIYKY